MINFQTQSKMLPSDTSECFSQFAWRNLCFLISTPCTQLDLEKGSEFLASFSYTQSSSNGFTSGDRCIHVFLLQNVFKMHAQTFSYPHLDQTQSLCFIHLGTIPEALPGFDLENHQGELVQEVVPGYLLFPYSWIRHSVRLCKVLEMYLSWQQRSCGSGSCGIHSSPPLSLTEGCKTFHVRVHFINVGLYNLGSICGRLGKNDNLQFLLNPLQSWFCSHRDLKARSSC